MSRSFSFILALAALLLPFTASAEKVDSTVQARYSYQVQVINQHNPGIVKAVNSMLESHRSDARRRASDPSIGEVVRDEYTKKLIEKTMKATGSLFTTGIEFLSAASKTHTRAYRFAEWQKYVTSLDTIKRKIVSEKPINDFYYQPSKDGAYDTSNLKFEGFSCYNYIETQESLSKREESDDEVGRGHDVFFVRCLMRTDSLGIANIAYHSKFLMEIDTLVFYPDYCSVPKDNRIRTRGHFDFNKREGLTFRLNVTLYSSWISDDQKPINNDKLGTFTISAKIEEDALQEINGERVFVYGSHTTDPRIKSLVGIVGDSFVVPRSFIGSKTEPSWGTGQYRLEFEMQEMCSIKESYYMVANPEKYEGIRKWDKKKWKPEWRAMKRGDESKTFLKVAWEKIKIAYIGGDWVEDIVTPVTTELYKREETYLRKALQRK